MLISALMIIIVQNSIYSVLSKILGGLSPPVFKMYLILVFLSSIGFLDAGLLDRKLSPQRVLLFKEEKEYNAI